MTKTVLLVFSVMLGLAGGLLAYQLYPGSLPGQLIGRLIDSPLKTHLREEQRNAESMLAEATEQGRLDAMSAPPEVLKGYIGDMHRQAKLGKTLLIVYTESDVAGGATQAVRSAYWKGYADGMQDITGVTTNSYGCGDSCLIVFFW